MIVFEAYTINDASGRRPDAGWAGGGTGRRARLRSVCRKACGFESHPAQIFPASQTNVVWMFGAMRLTVLFSIFLAGCSALPISAVKRIPSYKRLTCKAVYAVEGDLLLATCGNKLERIRLIGIDSPETVKSRKAKRRAKKGGRSLAAELARGSKAANYVRGLVHEGDKISLVFDRRQRDESKRLLAYVYLPDGGMLNARILETGYAVPAPRSPNTRYKKLFAELHRRAVKVGRGLWRR